MGRLTSTTRLGVLVLCSLTALGSSARSVAHGGPGWMGGGYGPGWTGDWSGPGRVHGGYGPGRMGDGRGPGWMGGRDGSGARAGGPGPDGDDLPVLIDRLSWLGLSDVQRERVLSIQREHLEKIEPLRERLMSRRRALDEALRGDDPDVESAGERYADTLDTERRLFEARLRRDAAIRDLLDERQRALLERMR